MYTYMYIHKLYMYTCTNVCIYVYTQAVCVYIGIY